MNMVIHILFLIIPVIVCSLHQKASGIDNII